MTETEFFYWLQGYFELAGPDATLTSDQRECVKRHMQLVRTSYNPMALNESFVRCELLLELGEVERLRSEIASHFQHVIDPAAGDQTTQEILNELHNGPVRPGRIPRC